jgi:cell wall-associated NlpC family hydrolase
MVIGSQQGSSIAEAREVSGQRGASKVLSGATPAANRIVLPDLTPKAAPRLMANVLPLPPVRNAIVSSTQTAARAANVVVAKTPAALRARAMEAPRTAPSSEQRRRVLMARLEADLNRAQNRLQGAREDITEGQQQLSKWNDVLRQAMLEAGPNASGLHPFVKTAQRYAGTPYVWGGESARGFDCSGFIIRVMRDLGYRALPHSAAEQFRYGVPIAESLLKPGDLVFFANTYKAGISHVGIYLGRRRFIHAAGTGKGTIVSTLDQSPYREKYAGSRRLVRASR